MTFTRIHALPLHLANQIAAGEVVERPASVLKELVENSIDAGATQIDILIEGAGNQLIQVTDNGSGIHRDDLVLALSRHATSKLHSSEQLSTISSLGFRGEALPSIASVSRFNLVSKQEDDDIAWKVSTDSIAAEPAAHATGTTVSAAELFFNLPARRRFLKSDKTESHHLFSSFYRLALSRYDIGFTARFDQQPAVKLPALKSITDFPQRIAKICGQAFVRQSCYLEQSFEGIHLMGWIGNLDAHRAQTDVQYFFINGRVIKDRVINHAIRQAYGERLPTGRQAAYVLYLTMPLDRVDVNVHPTKHEVRFRDGRLIHGLIHRAIDDALNNDVRTQTELPLKKESAAEVNEASADYSQTPLQKRRINDKKHPAEKTFTLDTTAPIIDQRYMVISAPEAALIDLQKADLALRQAQLKQAIANGNLSSRPILVPVAVPLDSSVIRLFGDYQMPLKIFGLEYKLTSDSITLTRIPYLLSSVALKTIVSHLSQALSSKPSKLEQIMTKTLNALLPVSPIHSTQQAKTIIEQLFNSEINRDECYRKLDSALLTGLFSMSNKNT